MLRKTTLLAAIVSLTFGAPGFAEELMLKFRIKGLASAPVEETVSWDQFATDKDLSFQSGWNGLTWSNQALAELPGAAYPNPTPTGSIYLNGNQLTNLAGLGSLTSVGGHLNLSHNRLSHVNELSGFTEATYTLDLGNNRITDISGLGSLRRLATLSLSSNLMTNLDGLSRLETVQSLQLQDNPNLVDLRGLRNIQSIGTNINLDSGIHTRPGFVPIPASAPICQDDHAIRFGGGYAVQGDVCEQSSADAWAAFANSRGLAYDSNWESVVWTGQGLTELPTAAFPNTTPSSFIRLNSNSLTSLGGFNNVTTISGDINLSDNNLVHVDELSSLRNAQSVILSNNPITDLSGLRNLWSTNYLTLMNLEITHLNGLGPTRSIIGLNLSSNPRLVDLSGLAVIPSVSWRVAIDKGIQNRPGFVPIPSSAPLCQAGQIDAFHDSNYAAQSEVCATP